jgi:hypothetical protein
LTEQALDTFQFENHWETPWDPTNSDVYRANFSMTLPDPHSVTGSKTSEYGVSNDTARKVWQVWAEVAPATFVRPPADSTVHEKQVFKVVWLSGAPAHNAVINTKILPWDTPNNVTAHMADAVTAMNQVVRKNTLSATYRHDVSVGRAFKNVVIVHVRWQWITLPAALLLFALIFLISTIWRASKEPSIGVWKTSALAVLFNGPGDDVQGFVGSGKKQGYVRTKARDMEVQLGDD